MTPSFVEPQGLFLEHFGLNLQFIKWKKTMRNNGPLVLLKEQEEEKPVKWISNTQQMEIQIFIATCLDCNVKSAAV